MVLFIMEDVMVGARIKNEIITVGEIENYERMRVKMKISIRMTIKMKTRMKITIKVPISCLEILHICNLWILLRKIVIYLVGRKFYLRGLFCS